MFGVLREGGRGRTDDSTCCPDQLLQLGSRQGRQRRRQTELEATNGLEMKCFNEDGLMWIGAARNGMLIRGVEPIESTI